MVARKMYLPLSLPAHFPQTYSGFILIDRISSVSNLEGRFVEAVIAYLFIVNLLPILIVPMMWYEGGKVAAILNSWAEFEVCCGPLRDLGTENAQIYRRFSGNLSQDGRRAFERRAGNESALHQHPSTDPVYWLCCAHSLRDPL